MKHLYRSDTEKMIAGVAGGLAEYFEIDVNLVRLLWVLAFFFSGGFFAFAYLIAWIFIPDKNAPETQEVNFNNSSETDPAIKDKRLRTGGFILIVLGLFFIFKDFIPKQISKNMIPIFLILWGIIILFRSFNNQGRN